MRGQASLEAIALFASATLLLTIFMMYFGTQIASHAEEREFESLRDISGTIRQEILLARQAGPGYERTLFLPNPGSNKQIVFTIEYPPGDGATEMTVRFEPPLRDTLEASEVLGEGVYGLFASGTNTIRTYPGGIIVEPELTYDDAVSFEPPIGPDIAFAHIDARSVRLEDTIECQYAVSNSWASQDGVTRTVDIAWIANDDSGRCTSSSITPGGPAILQPSAIIGLTLRKGDNLSCAARYREGSAPDMCTQVFASEPVVRTVRSNEVPVVNSPPRIIVNIDSAGPFTGSHDYDTRRTDWSSIRIGFVVEDADPDDVSFNISLVKDGTNANFITCGNCVFEETDSGTVEFDASIPWPVGGGCTDINRLSFKLRAIEADGSSELYTLKAVDLTGKLNCPPGGHDDTGGED